MKPLFGFYGGKHRLAKRLGPPRHDLVIEAFGGACGYSTFWEPRHVLVVSGLSIPLPALG